MNALIIILGYFAIGMIGMAGMLVVTLLGGGPTDSPWRDPFLNFGLALAAVTCLYAAYRLTVSVDTAGWGALSWLAIPAAAGIGWLVLYSVLQEGFKLW